MKIIKRRRRRLREEEEEEEVRIMLKMKRWKMIDFMRLSVCKTC